MIEDGRIQGFFIESKSYRAAVRVPPSKNPKPFNVTLRAPPPAKKLERDEPAYQQNGEDDGQQVEVAVDEFLCPRTEKIEK